ncbi:MAG: non-hydrolyzing UDP-N-acetylglucosamine 2-epimerase [Bacteroidota bacterium]|jgi:UDP-N-acetylglucosamine 2-epimerase (non-hydrolysing)|uniref:non-hydrolyzing UDP-N-acetylglucosamine 2-epimerase n=1 Tax=Candidatus Pollutiaquabacter sp. TaxID=3416354 RepID=UPI002C38397D|nr:UDP-N-acetylglucosamine 2-epimerase (non-hydrolyzing) [Bacteroidota bacterium]HRS37787.1 UDP-N-acetylglucosamine 2-epimerase (non-hydrolyzing) [Bacteroidia bacterium]HRU60154.1 UDP-N-acetylglucosamine 2-epimerase (non-hydrolyzing) [Bacteroidia bacterium]
MSPGKRLLFIFGTRPEAIKLAPLIREFQWRPGFTVKVAVTAQHREMLDQVLQFFSIRPDYDLNIMRPNQTLFDVTADGLKALQQVFDDAKPDLVFVQGDTTTSFIGALAAYYKKVKVAHVEAGLRSGDKYAPYPEEMNRIMAGHLADIHFTPTEQSNRNLAAEGITQQVFNVGNTVIDALFLGLDLLRPKGEAFFRAAFNGVNLDRKLVLITGHRRESFGAPFEQICHAIRNTAIAHPDVEFVYPVHLNPNVQDPVNRILQGLENVHLISPLDYPHFIWLMNRSSVVLTDSGGLQEEAPALGKPVLVMRNVTERQEGVDAGTARLVGTDRELIETELHKLLTNQTEYERMAKAVNPYGDGTACRKIVEKVNELI